MECAEVASKKIQADSHDVSIFPAVHANLYLGDVLFFNTGGTICECNPTTFIQVVGAANNYTLLFPCQKVADMFTKMTLNAHRSSQSPKDEQLPIFNSLVCCPITVIPENMYDFMHHLFFQTIQGNHTPLVPPIAPVPIRNYIPYTNYWGYFSRGVVFGS
ncbi:hypothetical protein DSO57_1027623 [Entomophthora muscae]|uniref:Uncharacterized protein n=1 Tax=Entomophthora muscae TaxID=34485 RepID=A0ACC2TP87_9FUNG|nr:hypothetical protein DSO57_1027623 [Entomophthora muscae]